MPTKSAFFIVVVAVKVLDGLVEQARVDLRANRGDIAF